MHAFGEIMIGDRHEKRGEFERMSVDDLWKLHHEIGEALAVKLAAEKDVLEARLKQLTAKPTFERRNYQVGAPAVPRPSSRNFATRMIRRKRGRDVASSHGGLQSNSGREGRRTILELRWRRNSFRRQGQLSTNQKGRPGGGL